MTRNNYNKKSQKRKERGLEAGDKLYYSAITEDRFSEAVRMTTKSALEPYFDFLNEAIKAEEEKGIYQIDWKIIESSFSLQIRPIFSKFKVEKPKTFFRFKYHEPFEENRNKVFFDQQDKTERFDKNDISEKDGWFYFTSDVLPKSDEIVEVNNVEVEYELGEITIKNGDILESGNEDFHIVEIDELSDGWNVLLKTDKNLQSLKFAETELNFSKYPISFEQLFDGEREFFCEKFGNEYRSEILPKNSVLKDENGFEYSWNKLNQQNSKNDIAIQLIDDDSIDDKSISDYFLSDEVSEIYQERGAAFKIKGKKVEDKILILRQDWNKPQELKKDQPILIKVDTANLKRQRDAVKLLNKTPIKEQRNLIKLFEKKNQNLWHKPQIGEIRDWYVLKDEAFDGTIDQRNLVKKAIFSEDFTILEGPPGSGKTTTILELILQLAKQGKRILLSASTHVAIDNVLERISKYDVDRIIEPLRIGREESIGEAVAHFQIDKKIEEFKMLGLDEELAKQLVLDTSNLVCGTIMGINQFPPIKERDKDLPIDTMFDYLIIDESSKTTFQEFLVPALLAKRWVIVGDIKQLSPFIEQSHIVHNLNVSVKKETQRAIRIVFETLYSNPNSYIVEVSKSEEEEIKKYLNYWTEIEDNPYSQKVVSHSDETDPFKLLGSDLILINDYNNKDRLPKTHIAIFKSENEKDSFWFEQSYLKKYRQLPKYGNINGNRSETNDVFQYKNFFKEMLKEKSWAEEIAWRMIRVYERRMLQNPNSYYEKTYKLLSPVDENSPVGRIYNMTLPSILESIQVGNGENHRHNTTITNGFDKRDLKDRHEVLRTQHRMHPDISQFSREHFYSADGVVALQDARSIKREWDYKRYKNRAVWLDVPKSEKDKNSDRRHKKEADKIIEELGEFLRFTSSTSKNVDKENWSVAVLTFYKPQETLIRESLRKFCNQPNKMSRFDKSGVDILLYTVDKFQGMEADMVFLSMVRGKSIGFMDNINRLNVALTRAKYQRVIFGDSNFFINQRSSEELKDLAKEGTSS